MIKTARNGEQASLALRNIVEVYYPKPSLEGISPILFEARILGLFPRTTTSNPNSLTA